MSYDLDYESEEKEFSFSGNYRGEVVSNADPKESGRCQIRVFGVFDDVEDECLPWAEYADPFMQGASGTGGFWVPDVGMKVWCFFENNDHMQPVYFAGAPSLRDMPAQKTSEDAQTSRGGLEYTKNRIIRTPAGHLVELDDTAGNSRVRIAHKSGSQIIMYDDGDVYEQVMGNYKRVVNGDYEEIINGNHKKSIIGDSKQTVVGDTSMESLGQVSIETPSSMSVKSGDLSVDVVGAVDIDSSSGFSVKTSKIDISSTGNTNMDAGGTLDMRGSTLHLNLGAPSPSAPSPSPAVIETPQKFTEFIPPEEYLMSPENGYSLINSTGSKAAFDEPEEQIANGWPAEESKPSVENPSEVVAADGGTSELSAACENITTVDYSYRLSQNFTLRHLSLGTVFPHSVKAQGGLSLSEIVCNMKNLAINILEPLKAQYPNIRINSGFRLGSGKSQHNKGQAVDIQIPGASAKVYTDVAAWIVKNLPYDQFILEHGKSVWLHISYNKNGGRRMRGTYYPRKAPQYQWGVLKNYYDNGRVVS